MSDSVRNPEDSLFKRDEAERGLSKLFSARSDLSSVRGQNICVLCGIFVCYRHQGINNNYFRTFSYPVETIIQYLIR